MINKKIAKLLNDQVTNEYDSAYLYLAMGLAAEAMNFKGLSNWLYVQYQEENTHGMRIAKHIIDRGGNVELGEIKEPKAKWKTPLDIAKEVLSHEQKITATLNNIMQAATEEKDFATVSLISWYINEQVEEEANAQELIAKFEMAEGNRGALMFIDNELAARTFQPAFPVKGTPAQLA